MNFTRIFDTLEYQSKTYPNDRSICHKRDGKWVCQSSDQLIEKVNSLSYWLLKNSFRKGDIACILSKSGSADWIIADLAIQQIGMITVPLHSNYNSRELKLVFDKTDSKLCFVENKEMMDLVQSANQEMEVLCFEPIENGKDIHSLIHGIEYNKTELDERKMRINEEDLATIIFTSGSTGNPKGVKLSHKNIISNLKALISINPLDKGTVCASFLPLSHVFERMSVYSYLAVGVSVYFVSDLSKLMEEIREIKPHFITSVPRILERTYDFIIGEIEEKKYLGKRIANWALKQGLESSLSEKFNVLEWMRLKIADMLIYHKWRKAMGGRLKKIVVGAAAMNPSLAKLYSAAGIEVREGYGLTETSPAVSFNRFEPGGNRFGTVGIALPGVEIRIDKPDESGEGEILVRGPNVMLGYYKDEKLTSSVIDHDGWFHTGDVGKIVNKRFLKITDRKKNIFKTSSGRYVSPQSLENLLHKNVYVYQCMIIGFQKPFVTALIVPHFDRLKNWCKENKVHWTSEQFMVLNPKVNHFYKTILDRINQDLKSHERIKRFTLLYKEWTIQSGELSSTLKVKREVILSSNQKYIETMYTEVKR